MTNAINIIVNAPLSTRYPLRVWIIQHLYKEIMFETREASNGWLVWGRKNTTSLMVQASLGFHTKLSGTCIPTSAKSFSQKSLMSRMVG